MEGPGPSGRTVRRTAACERCRKSKIRCDLRDRRPCSSCRNRNYECISVPSKGRTKTNGRSEYLHSIEERLTRMEAVLGNPTMGLETSSPDTNSLAYMIKEQASVDQKRKSLHLLKGNGETDFIGLSSGLTLLSPAGVEWLSSRVGSSNTEKLIATIDFFRSSFLSFAPVPQRMCSQPRKELPPKSLATVYVNAFFETLSPWLPFFEKSIIDSYFEKQYSDTPPSCASWYAAFNAILCFGYTIVQKAPILFQDKSSATWGYLGNAMSVLPELMFSEGDTLAIQAIISMASLYNSIMSFQTSSMLLSVAVRLAITKGFHRKEDIPTEAGATKQSVFWIAYIIDKGMCIRFGQAPMIDDDEIGIDLPPSDTSDAETSFLRCSVELALIQSKVCKWLYSPRFRTKPAGQRLQLMNELNNLLDTWHKGIPLRFTPEYHQSHHNAQIKIDPALNMHMNYYYAIICLHRTSLGISLEPDLEEAQRQESLTNVGMSAKLCLQASRATINLLNYGDGTLLTHYITFWSISFHALVAALVIFVHILDNPRRSEVQNIAYLQLFTKMVHMTPLSRISPIGKGLDDLADLLVNITTSAMEKHTPLVDSSAPVVCPSPGTDLTPSNRALETEGPVNFPSNFSDFDFEGGPWPSAEVTSDIFDFLFDPAHFSNDFI